MPGKYSLPLNFDLRAPVTPGKIGTQPQTRRPWCSQVRARNMVVGAQVAVDRFGS